MRSWWGTCQLKASRTPGLLLHSNCRQERRKEPLSKHRTAAFHALSLKARYKKKIQHVSVCVYTYQSHVHTIIEKSNMSRSHLCFRPCVRRDPQHDPNA